MLDPLKLADEIERGSLSYLDDCGDPCRGLSGEEYVLIVRALRALRAIAHASDDVRERMARAMIAATTSDIRPLNLILAESAILRLVDAALSALCPGDRIGGCVLVPEADATEPYLAGFRTAVEIIDSLTVEAKWGRAATPDDGLREGLASARDVLRRQLATFLHGNTDLGKGPRATRPKTDVRALVEADTPGERRGMEKDAPDV